MNSLGLLNLYLALNIFLISMACCWAAINFLEKSHGLLAVASRVLKMQYFLLTSLVFFAGALIFFPSSRPHNSIIQIFQSKESQNITLTLSAPFSTQSDKVLVQSIPESSSSHTLIVLGFLVLLLATTFIFLQLRKLYFLINSSYCTRKINRTKILYNDFTCEPFSFYFWGNLYIVLPLYLAEEPQILKLVVKHEIQHHRQGDTRWIYFLTFLNLICFWNPFAHFYFQKLFETQEFACDEVLIHQKRVPPQAYAGHLLWVAERATLLKKPLCALGFLANRSQLKWRIDKMINNKLKPKYRATTLIGLASFFCFFAAAWSSKAIIQDKRLSFEQATTLAKNAESGEFPLPVNEDVLKSLNYFVGTENGRTSMKEALERMEAYRTLVEGKLDDYSMPQELMSIPIIESGYRNLPDSNNVGWGAGLWMFIKGTAKNFGLRVDNVVDERLNEELLTDAAMRLLTANKLRFNDWHLSVLAYYVGEGKVQKFIDKTGSRNPWTLVEAGIEQKRGYLANIVATAIIIKNSHLVQ